MSSNLNYTQNWAVIESLTLTNFSGKTEDIRKYFLSIDIQEDIFIPVVSGSITLIDPHSFYEDFPIIGEELLTITYKDFFSEVVTRTFAVYGVPAKEKGDAERGSVFTLNFCSEELLYSKLNPYSKSYRDKDTHTILEDAMTRTNPTKPLNIQPTVELQDYIATNVTPFDVCSAMCARGISAEGHVGSYIFYEDLTQFNFVAIEQLITQPALEYVIGGGATVAGYGDSPLEKSRIVRKYRYDKPVNQLGAMSSGAHGVTTKTLNLMTRELEDASYDYFDDEDYQKTERVNSRNPDLRMTSSKYKHQSNKGVYKLVVKNTEEGLKSSRNKTMSRRYNTLSSYTKGLKIHSELPFNATLTVGNMIDMRIPKEDARNEESERERYMSGKYLVIALRQILTPDKGITVVEMAKDSYSQSHEENDEYKPQGDTRE